MIEIATVLSDWKGRNTNRMYPAGTQHNNNVIIMSKRRQNIILP